MSTYSQKHCVFQPACLARVCLVLYVCTLISSYHQGMAFILHPSERELEPSVSSDAEMPTFKTNRCQGEPLQAIKQMLLKELNLKQEPEVFMPELARFRELWKAAFIATAHSSSQEAKVEATSMLESPEITNHSNHTGLQCCQLTSQVFIKDLGWENWIVYPESFTYVQCRACNPHTDLPVSSCRPNTAHELNTPPECCQPTTHKLVPFLYVDEFNSLVISTVHLARECHCKPDTKSSLPAQH
ncbi:growth/differentiation factor 6-B-like isoform X1 [Scleropages formosus]|uniref:Growth/differentiation factor 6-like n=2 Tax=Scleropages formosus TaxID=113540 RepID=A0A8C9VA36_SCLFO|nr:growth/differentiation factor 6-B-like isoform X1 [Scleropages formosus]